MKHLQLWELSINCARIFWPDNICYKGHWVLYHHPHPHHHIVIICYFFWRKEKLLWGVFAARTHHGGRNNLEINLDWGQSTSAYHHLNHGHHHACDYHHHHQKAAEGGADSYQIINWVIYSRVEILGNGETHKSLMWLWKIGFVLVSARRSLLCPLFASEPEEVALRGSAILVIFYQNCTSYLFFVGHTD